MQLKKINKNKNSKLIQLKVLETLGGRIPVQLYNRKKEKQESSPVKSNLINDQTSINKNKKKNCNSVGSPK